MSERYICEVITSTRNLKIVKKRKGAIKGTEKHQQSIILCPIKVYFSV